jgi:hypothetical protein
LITAKDKNRNHRRKTKEDEGYLQIRKKGVLTMRIIIIRSGGFTGIPVEVSIDEKDLPEQEADEIHTAVRESQFFALPTKLPDHSGGADKFNYTITVEDVGRAHTVVGSESALPEALKKLVQSHMRKGRA